MRDQRIDRARKKLLLVVLCTICVLLLALASVLVTYYFTLLRTRQRSLSFVHPPTYISPLSFRHTDRLVIKKIPWISRYFSIKIDRMGMFYDPARAAEAFIDKIAAEIVYLPSTSFSCLLLKCSFSCYVVADPLKKNLHISKASKSRNKAWKWSNVSHMTRKIVEKIKPVCNAWMINCSFTKQISFLWPPHSL